jgi:dolichyl-phosphate-mannose--protein O-mannosyl transferase
VEKGVVRVEASIEMMAMLMPTTAMASELRQTMALLTSTTVSTLMETATTLSFSSLLCSLLLMMTMSLLMPTAVTMKAEAR